MIKVFVLTSNRIMYRETALRVIQEQGMEAIFSEALKFNFGDLNPDYMHWSTKDYAKVITTNDLVKTAMAVELTRLKECDAVLVIGPCGRHSHFMAGYAMGTFHKKVYCWLTIPQSPDLAYVLFDRVSDDIISLVTELKAHVNKKEISTTHH